MWLTKFESRSKIHPLRKRTGVYANEYVSPNALRGANLQQLAETGHGASCRVQPWLLRHSDTNSIGYFIIYQFFPKLCNFLRKWQKTISGVQVSFEGKEASGGENEYKLFYGKMRSWIFYRLPIFSKRALFLETRETIFCGHDHFLGEGVILRQKWI